MKRFFAIFLILIIAGCTGSSFGGGNGVSLSISANPTSIKDTQKSLLTISVKNNGDVDTTPMLNIYGLGDEWQFTTPSFNELKASNKDIGYTAEEIKETIFLAYQGGLSKGKLFTFNPYARICYAYNTQASAKVDVYSEEEYYRENPVQKGISVKQTKAPITISIDSKQPLISGENLLLDVTLSNVGGGTVTTAECGDLTDNDIDFKTLNTINNLDISLSDGTPCKSIDANKIYLRKGDTAQLTISCDGAFTTSNPKDTKDLRLNINYNYYIDAKTSITVEGTKSTDYGGGDYDGKTTIGKRLMNNDFCSQLCFYNDETYYGSGDQKYLGVCKYYELVDDSIQLFTFSQTSIGEKDKEKSVKAMLDKPEWSKIIFEQIPNYDKLLIKDLKLQDARVKDFNILEMTLGELDNNELSAQYSDLDVDDGDRFIGIMDAICSKSIDAKSATNNKNTVGDLCDGNTHKKNMKSIVLKDILTINGLETKDSLEFDELNNASIKTFKITEILGITIESMDLGIDYISVGSFKLANLLDDHSSYDFLRFAECTYGDKAEERTDEKETQCMCVNDVDPPLNTNLYVGTSTECNDACDKFYIGGACLDDSITVTKTKECRSGSIYTYVAATNAAVIDCKPKSKCYCYTKESLTSLEQDLLCP
ncbi:hypothetical protein GQ473_06000 [archaeon]|nr:hypothetical protein [archaeon]